MLGREHISLGLCGDRPLTAIHIFSQPPLCSRHYHILVVSLLYCASPCYRFVLDFLTFFGAFAKFRKVTLASLCLSVCPYGTTRLSLGGFS